MSAEASVYLDSSALVKLVVSEVESAALANYLKDCPSRMTSALARVEVVRAVRPHGVRAVSRAQQVLARISLLRIDDSLLDAAGALEGEALRSLDAIHLASAQTLGGELAEIVTYDRRMADAAASIGLTVTAPA